MPLTGKYTIAEVEERTGVPAATLRQWERRYGFPNPQRSGGGYRLYSEHDLGQIRQMRSHMSDGVPPSRAAELVRQEAPDAEVPRAPSDLATDLVTALTALDANAAERVMSEAYALHPVEEVLLGVISPAMVRIGDLWHAGEVTVATEHFATQVVQSRLRLLLAMSPRASGALRVVVACAPGEMHELGPLILAILLGRRGVDVVYLGANTPLEDLAELVASTPVDAIMLSAGMPDSLERLGKQRLLLRSLKPMIVFGGRAFEATPEAARELGGVYLGNDLRTAVPELIGRVATGSNGRVRG